VNRNLGQHSYVANNVDMQLYLRYIQRCLSVRRFSTLSVTLMIIAINYVIGIIGTAFRTMRQNKHAADMRHFYDNALNIVLKGT
jgi:hypothetical protein